MMALRSIVRVVLAVVVLAMAPLALAQSPPLELDPDFGPAGSTTLASGTGYAPGVGVVFHWSDGSSIGTATADSTGGFSGAPLSIPATASPGSHSISACQPDPATGGETCPGVATFTVPSPPTTTTTTTTTTTIPPTTTSTTRPPVTTTTTVPPTTTTTIAVFGAVIPDPPPNDFDLSIPPPDPDPGPGNNIAVPTTVPPPPDDLEIPLPDVFPDLVARRIEVTQGIQNLDNLMPLVSGRRTYVRVYASVVGKDTWPVYGAIEVSRGGQVLGYRWPEGGGIVARSDGGDRAKLKDSLYFLLPDTWADGEVTIRTFIYSYSTDTPFTKEPWSFNNYQTETVKFHEGQPATLHLVPLHLHRSYHPADVPRVYQPDLGGGFQIGIEPEPSNTLYSINGMYRFHPIADLSYELETSDFYRQPLPVPHAMGAEWNLGPCQTTLDHFVPSANFFLPTFDILYDDDPGDLGEGNNKVLFEPDYRTLYVLDRVVKDIKHYIELDPDGGYKIFGDSNNAGPDPLPQTPVFVGGCKPSQSDYSAPNKHMGLFRIFEDFDDEREFFVGMVDPSLPTFFTGLATGSADAAWVKMSNSFSGAYPWSHSAAGTVAHEVGHLVGLRHVPCRDSDGDGEPDELIGGSIDETHPAGAVFPDCSLSDVDPTGYYGFDVYWKLWGLAGPTVISNDPAADLPGRGYPFMGYQGPGWPDPYHYCVMLEYYGVGCDPADIGVPGLSEQGGGGLAGKVAPPISEGDPVAFMGGTYDTVTGAIVVDQQLGLGLATGSLVERAAGQSSDTEPFPFSVVVIGAGGNVLYADQLSRTDSGHEPLQTLDWGSIVPITDAATVELRALTGDTLFVFPVSTNPPGVEFTATAEPDLEGARRFSWSATDTDRDPLLATLLYSSDGEHWEVVVPYNPAGSVDLEDISGLPGSDAGRFMVRVSDGFNVSEAVTDAVYRVPNKPPTVQILTPLTGTGFPLGAEVIMVGSGTDLEDRTLDGSSLRWESSVDGSLGTGTFLATTTLTPGEHTIRLTATDSAGPTSFAEASVTVDPNVVQVLPGAAWVGSMEAAFAQEASAPRPDDESPTTTGPAAVPEPQARPTSPIVPLAIGLALALAAAFAWRLFAQRRQTELNLLREAADKTDGD